MKGNTNSRLERSGGGSGGSGGDGGGGGGADAAVCSRTGRKRPKKKGYVAASTKVVGREGEGYRARGLVPIAWQLVIPSHQPGTPTRRSSKWRSASSHILACPELSSIFFWPASSRHVIEPTGCAGRDGGGDGGVDLRGRSPNVCPSGSTVDSIARSLRRTFGCCERREPRPVCASCLVCRWLLMLGLDVQHSITAPLTGEHAIPREKSSAVVSRWVLVQGRQTYTVLLQEPWRCYSKSQTPPQTPLPHPQRHP